MPINTSSLGVRTGKVVTPTHGSGWNYGGVWGNGYIADITPSPVKVAENAIMASGALPYTSVYISNDGVSGATSGTLYGSGNNRGYAPSLGAFYTLINGSLTTDPDTFTSSGATFSYVCPFTNAFNGSYSQFLMGIRGGTLWVRGYENGGAVSRVGIWNPPPLSGEVAFNGWKLTTDAPDAYFISGVGATLTGITLGNWHSAATSATNTFPGTSGRGILFLLNRNGTLWSAGRQSVTTSLQFFRNGGQLGLGSAGNTAAGPTRIESGTTADWIAVSAGLNHAVGIRGSSGGIGAGSTAGNLWAWGTNLYGQVGDGTTTTRNSPVAIGATGGVWSAVACGAWHTLALKTDGTLWSWGLNASGQLGLGFTSGSISPIAPAAGVTTPTQIGSSGGWAAISAVSDTSFAIRTDGSLWSWGANYDGLLGIGDSSVLRIATTPTRIGTDSDWARLGTPVDYGSRQFAIKTDNSLWGWGYNRQGSLGVANSFTKSSGFAQTTTNQFVDVLGNRTGHLGLKSDGSLWVWGTNMNGEFGTGRTGQNQIPYDGVTSDVFLSPVQATGGSWKEIGQMDKQFSAIRSDGTLWYAGLLGNTYAVNWTQLGTASNWTKLTRSPHATHTHALRDNGTLWAWCQNGGNLYAACGIGTTGSAAIVSPVQVGNSGGWIAVASGKGVNYSVQAAFSIAIREASSGATYGTIWGAGGNAEGALGNVVAGFPNLNFSQGATGSDWAKISTYASSCFGIKTNRTLWGWGYNGINAFETDNRHSAWLGIGQSTSLSQTFTPTQLGSSADWVDVYAGTNCSMAVNSSGVVYGWGHNISQQLTSSGGATYGSFANAYADTPTPITVLTGRKAPPKLCFSESSAFVDYDAYYDYYYYDSFNLRYEPYVFGTFAPITFQA